MTALHVIVSFWPAANEEHWQRERLYATCIFSEMTGCFCMPLMLGHLSTEVMSSYITLILNV